MEILKGFIKKHIRLSIAALALLVVLVLIFGRGRNKALGNTYFDKQCVSIEIEEGDTLWSIAKSYYVPECGSMNDYIAEIKKTNRLCTDDIHAGCYLIVPYYIPAH
ncbi:MAG: LysM peptidoglycan-binding domain-containing protein [Lachnospiraceae bacterium]|nr:LysM peptidoglycan-binding domain-containing protein [Lachnospiraceae bacterium]